MAIEIPNYLQECHTLAKLIGQRLWISDCTDSPHDLDNLLESTISEIEKLRMKISLI